ncbi:MAG: hypothetical protein CMJ74_04680 [Planctomycetaceae bacterium]|nr:hypothetical protein [Planctomycetaceae bacterium]
MGGCESMNFALLGSSPLIGNFESQLANSKIHRRVYRSDDLQQVELADLERSGAEIVIFDGQDAEAVLLAALQTLKGFPGIVFVSPLCPRTVLTAYEFERISGESIGEFIPLLPLLQHAGLAQLLGHTKDTAAPTLASAVGDLESIDMQRPLATTDSEGVLDAFTRDMPVLFRFAGSIKEVVAMRTGSEPIPLNVQCTSDSDRLVRWSAIRPSREQSAAQILIEGTRGRVRIQLRESGDWDIDTSGQEFSFSAMDLLALCTEDPQEPDYLWKIFSHSLEVREAVAKSLQRGRLVRINLDGHGERTAFMGTMASLGCALLLGSLGMLVLSAAILSLVPEDRFGRLYGWVEKVPWILAIVMILFLLIQFFALVIPRRSGD